MKATKVRLRQRLLPSGRITLYLDFYPPLRMPGKTTEVRHEYLGIYLVNNPKFAEDKEANKEKIKQAEALRAHRVGLTRKKLLEFRSLGPCTLHEITKFLATMGLELASD